MLRVVTRHKSKQRAWPSANLGRALAKGEKCQHWGFNKKTAVGSSVSQTLLLFFPCNMSPQLFPVFHELSMSFTATLLVHSLHAWFILSMHLHCSAPNGPVLFNEILSSFSETTDRIHKLHSRSMCRGENFDLQLLLEPRSVPLQRNHRTRTEPQQWNPFRSKGFIFQDDLVLTSLYHKWPSSKVLQPKLVPPALRHPVALAP